ncbi:MAG: PIN domain-containing protein, partial [Ignavibacteriaceae bacterium]|nr:PIN domain-containing protein [Ignavibacteriaceae bacterium]
MKTIKVYVDTSIIGGVFDSEFASATTKFFDQVNEGRFQLVISALVEEELLAAPEKVKDFFDGIYKQALIIDVSEDAIQLREYYLKANIVTKKSSNDALHVA